MASREDIAKMVAILQAAFPNWKLSEYTLEVYWQDLRDIETEELFAAAQYCRTQAGRAFAPSTGELRGAVMDMRKLAINLPSSFDAWREVQRNIIDCGHNGSPQWSNVIVEKTVKAIGWRHLCMSEDATADRARFIQAYEQYTERAEKEMMLTPEVRGYLVANGALLPAPLDSIKLLADRMKK